MIEVAIESTFQPLLQMYLLLPFIIQESPRLSLQDLQLNNLIQILSLLSSIVSLAWSFAFYKATIKREVTKNIDKHSSEQDCISLEKF